MYRKGKTGRNGIKSKGGGNKEIDCNLLKHLHRLFRL